MLKILKAGVLVGKNNNQELMVAGNAIERVYKNINEIRNFMLDEYHFRMRYSCKVRTLH